MGGAADGADGDVTAEDLTQVRALRLTTTEDPQGLVEHRAQRHEPRRLLRRDGAGLDECRAHPGFRVAQLRQVVERAARRHQPHRDALLREQLPVTFGIDPVRAAIRAPWPS